MVVQTESFESTIFPCPGWKKFSGFNAVNGSFVLAAIATTTNPTAPAAPSGGAQVLMFNSFVAGLNDTAFMVSKPFDFSNNGGVNPQLSFYMYRDNGWLANDDRIEVLINTVPSEVGATLLTNTLGTTSILRRNNGAPVAAANTWNQYTYNLNAAIYNGKKYYFIFRGIAGDGNHIYIDRIAVNTYPSAMNKSDVSAGLFYQNQYVVAAGTINAFVVGLRCIVGGNSGCGNIALGTAVKIDSLLLSTTGTTNLADINDAKIYYTGGSPIFDTTYVSPFPATAGTADYPTRKFGQTIATPGANLNFSNAAVNCFYLEYDTTYFWLTYDVNPLATSWNHLDAQMNYMSVGGANAACPSPPYTGSWGYTVNPFSNGTDIPGSTNIGPAYCIPAYTLGTSRFPNNDYIQSVLLNGANGTTINTTLGASNNNFGLPGNLPCLVSNGGPGCDYTAHPPDYDVWPMVAGRTAQLTVGMSYSITLQTGTWPTANCMAAWIDFNNDGDFSDAGEKLGQLNNLSANASGVLTFVVPVSAIYGQTVLRVREVNNISNIDPCATYTYGEAEDFYVAIIPNCPAGTKLWLGINSNWNDPINWCGGVPAITDDVQIDKTALFPPAGVPTYAYSYPVIGSGVAAKCNALTISSLDTLNINAPSPAGNALKVRGALTLNGRFEVVNTFSGSKTFGTGTTTNSTQNLFKATATDVRAQLLYTPMELSAAGFLAGDQINSIQFVISSKSSTSPFNGFRVSYALVNYFTFSFGTGTPYTGGMTQVYGPQAYSTVAGTNNLTLGVPITWDGSSGLLIQFCYDNTTATGPGDDRIDLTTTTGIKTALILSSTTNATAGCSLVPGAGVTDNFFVGNGSLRPNLTFGLNRPYSTPQIVVQQNWVNKGTFVAGNSRVILDSSQTQSITGTGPTTFHELQINKTTASTKVTLNRSITVKDTLTLTNGQLLLNGKTLTISNPASNMGLTPATPAGPITRTGGFIVTSDTSSLVKWNVGSASGYRVIPFGDAPGAGTVYTPFSFYLTSGNLGIISVNTYKAINNLPWPSAVTQLNDTAFVNNAANTVDRFWQITKTGNNPVCDLTFGFATSERPAGMTVGNPGKAQPWRTSTYGGWYRLTPPMTSTGYTQTYGQNATGYDTVRVSGYNWPFVPSYNNLPAGNLGNSNPWTISKNSSPLSGNSYIPIVISVINVTDESCPGSFDGSISISVTGGTPPYVYQWSNGSTAQNLNGLSTGLYTIIITDSNGNTQTMNITVGLTANLPVTPTSINGWSFGVCGKTKSYTILPVAGTSYQWTVPSGAVIQSGQGSDSIVIAFSGSFSSGVLSVVASTPCGVSSARTKTIYGKPTKPAAINGPSTLCYNVLGQNFICPTTAGASTYTWTVPSGVSIVNGQGNDTIVLNFSTIPGGNGVLSVVAGNNCGISGSRSLTLNYLNCPRLAGGEENAFRLYPNPAGDEVWIEFEQDMIGQGEIRCINMLGQVVHSEELIFDHKTKRMYFNTTKLKEGIYSLTIVLSNASYSARLIISR